MGIKVKQDELTSTPNLATTTMPAEKSSKKRKNKEKDDDSDGKKLKVDNLVGREVAGSEHHQKEKTEKKKEKLGKNLDKEEPVCSKTEKVEGRKKEKKKKHAENKVADFVANKATEGKRKKRVEEGEAAGDAGGAKSKAKFSLSLSTATSSPSLEAFRKKKKGPKIVIAQSDGDVASAAAADRKQRKNRNKKKKGKEGAVHESKGMNKALRYLKTWMEDRSNWKFEKCRQIWLLHNAYDVERISETNFPLLLEYMTSIRGAMRDKTVAEAQQKRDRAAQWQAKLDAEIPEADIISEMGAKMNVTELERAEKIVACLTSSE